LLAQATLHYIVAVHEDRSSATKAKLERAARQRKVRIAAIIDTAIEDWLNKNENSDKEEQQRLHAVAGRYLVSSEEEIQDVLNVSES
jgi:hypothetical protein